MINQHRLHTRTHYMIWVQEVLDAVEQINKFTHILLICCTFSSRVGVDVMILRLIFHKTVLSCNHC